MNREVVGQIKKKKLMASSETEEGKKRNVCFTAVTHEFSFIGFSEVELFHGELCRVLRYLIND